MRKEVKLLSMFSMLVLLLVPFYSSCISAVPQQQTQDQQTTRVLCIIGKQKIIKELPVSLLESLLVLGKSKREDFLTLYNKYASQEEVATAFQNIQPFFQELVRSGLTDKSVGDLNDLFHTIRDMIKKPRRNPEGPQPGGSWNGLPTFLVGNTVSGIFCADGPAVGFALGTHTLLPTIGADAFITWAGTGETVSIGSLGFTTSTGPEFGCIFGFIGVLLATPIMIAGLLFMTGFAAFYLGIGPVPF
jgi:hypothetical protein